MFFKRIWYGMIGKVLTCHDIIFRRSHGLMSPEAFIGKAVLLEMVAWRGHTFGLGDGTIIRKGVKIGIIHINNEFAATLHRNPDEGLGSAIIRLRREFVLSLKEIARQIEEEYRYPGVVAFVGETIFWQETRPLGFEVKPILSRIRRSLVSLNARAVVARCHPEGWKRAEQLRSCLAHEVWISKKELLRIFYWEDRLKREDFFGTRVG